MESCVYMKTEAASHKSIGDDNQKSNISIESTQALTGRETESRLPQSSTSPVSLPEAMSARRCPGTKDIEGT